MNTAHSTVFLRGLDISSDSLQLSDNILIRKPTNSESNKIVDNIQPDKPIVIIEFSYQYKRTEREAAEQEMLSSLAPTVDALQLFYACSITWIWYSISIQEHKPFEFDRRHNSVGQYTRLVKSDINDRIAIDNFISIFSILLKLRKMDYCHSKEGSFNLNFAMDRYKKILLSEQGFESLVDCFIGLEALFISNDGRIKRGLTTRICKLFQVLDFDEPKLTTIKSVLERGYKLRSEFVHDSDFTKTLNKIDEEFQDFSSFFLLLFNIFRVSILIMLSLQMDKSQFVRLLDDSLLFKSKETELKQLLIDNKSFTEVLS